MYNMFYILFYFINVQLYVLWRAWLNRPLSLFLRLALFIRGHHSGVIRTTDLPHVLRRMLFLLAKQA